MANSISNTTRLGLALEHYQWHSDDPVSQIESLAESFSQQVNSVSSWISTAWSGSNEDLELVLNPGSCSADADDYLKQSGGNCSSACSDKTTLFLPFNIGPCLGLSSAAVLVQDEGLEHIQNEQVDDQLHVGDLMNWNGSEIIEYIMDCAVASCSTSNISDCPDEVRSLTDVEVKANNLQTILDGLEALCDCVGLSVNSDIAGPGVMSSYLLQISAAFLFWLILKVLTSWPRTLAWPFLVCAGKTEKKKKMMMMMEPEYDPNLAYAPRPTGAPGPGRARSAWVRAGALQGRLRHLRLHAATVSTLVEFQEVQAFFIGAIQIATLATFRPNGSSQSDARSTSSFGEAILDSQLVQTLAVNGILPIVLVQHVLQRYNMRWLYSFALLWVTFVLALVVKARRNSLISEFDVLWRSLNAQHGVDECGGNANPMVYCNTYALIGGGIGGEIYVVYCAMVILTFDFMAPRVRRWRLFQAFTAGLGMLGPEEQAGWWAARMTCLRAMGVVWFLLEYILAGTVAYYLMTLLEIAFMMTNGVNTWGSWSFGQLVSVMVWVPTLFKFIYYNIFGIEEGVAIRLMKSYRVLHDERLDEADSHWADVEFDELQQCHGLTHQEKPACYQSTTSRSSSES